MSVLLMAGGESPFLSTQRLPVYVTPTYPSLYCILFKHAAAQLSDYCPVHYGNDIFCRGGRQKHFFNTPGRAEVSRCTIIKSVVAVIADELFFILYSELIILGFVETGISSSLNRLKRVFGNYQ